MMVLNAKKATDLEEESITGEILSWLVILVTFSFLSFPTMEGDKPHGLVSSKRNKITYLSYTYSSR